VVYGFDSIRSTRENVTENESATSARIAGLHSVV